MNTIHGVSGRLFLGGSFREGWLAWKAGRIQAVGEGAPPRAHRDGLLDLGRRRILPGFVDTLVHGYAGHDAGEAQPLQLAEMSRELARAGVTTALAGFYPMQTKDLRRSARAWDAWKAQRDGSPRCRIPGWHLEGPFIPPEMRGGLPSTGISRPSAVAARALLAACRGWLRMTTLAPEMPGAMSAARVLAEARVRLSIGHTVAGIRHCAELAALAPVAMTHLGNRMPALAAREPGPIGFALQGGARWVGVIPDGAHVVPESLRLFASTPALASRLMFTSDNLSHSGLAARSFRSGGKTLHRDGAVARDARGGLSGTLDSLPRLVLQRVKEGALSWEQAVRGACEVPGSLVGGRGRLQKGLWADLIVLDARGGIRQVFVGGRPATDG